MQGNNVAQIAATPRNVEVSWNNVYLTGTTNIAVKLFSFFNSRFEGNLIDDKGFASSELVDLGDTYNSSFVGNTVKCPGIIFQCWLSIDESGNSTVGNQIYSVPAGAIGMDWESSAGVLSNNSITSNNVQLTSGVTGTCYQVRGATTSFNADSNPIGLNNCLGTGTAGQIGFLYTNGTASGASNLLNLSLIGNTFTNLPLGIQVTTTAQTGAGPLTIKGILINDNVFVTVTTAVQINPPASSGGGAVNVSGVFLEGNQFNTVTTLYSATPGAGNSIVGTKIGPYSFTGTAPLISDTGTLTQVNQTYRNVTPVTVNTNTTAEQTLMEVSVSAGYFDTTGVSYDFFGAGTYVTQAAQTPTLTFKIKLCTVSGCGSGTVVPLSSILTTATVASIVNNNWSDTLHCSVTAAGATGNLECHGDLLVDLGALTATADSSFGDTNNAVSSPNIDLTAALFVDYSITFSTNAATANTMTQRLSTVKF